MHTAPSRVTVSIMKHDSYRDRNSTQFYLGIVNSSGATAHERWNMVSSWGILANSHILSESLVRKHCVSETTCESSPVQSCTSCTLAEQFKLLVSWLPALPHLTAIPTHDHHLGLISKRWSKGLGNSGVWLQLVAALGKKSNHEQQKLEQLLRTCDICGTVVTSGFRSTEGWVMSHLKPFHFTVRRSVYPCRRCSARRGDE